MILLISIPLWLAAIIWVISALARAGAPKMVQRIVNSPDGRSSSFLVPSTEPVSFTLARLYPPGSPAHTAALAGEDLSGFDATGGRLSEVSASSLGSEVGVPHKGEPETLAMPRSMDGGTPTIYGFQPPPPIGATGHFPKQRLDAQEPRSEADERRSPRSARLGWAIVAAVVSLVIIWSVVSSDKNPSLPAAPRGTQATQEFPGQPAAPPSSLAIHPSPQTLLAAMKRAGNIRTAPTMGAPVARVAPSGTLLHVFSRSGGRAAVGDATPWGYVNENLITIK